MENILAIWQTQGQSTHEIARQISEEMGVKTSHTGTLDPMAEGVVIILLGEDRHKKYEYAKWTKGYYFEILLGIKTDTLDGMGIIEEKQLNSIISKTELEAELPKILEEFVGDYEQEVPAYSAIKVKGKSLHWWARNNRLEEIDIPKRSGKIYKCELKSLETVDGKNEILKIIGVIKKVKGDLRQERILQQWEEFLENENLAELIKIGITVETSKGLYVRQLAQDICAKAGAIGFTSYICRYKNGKYSRDNSTRMSPDNF